MKRQVRRVRVNNNDQQLTGWQLDHSAPESYERFLVPAIFDAWTDRLLGHVSIEEGDHLLDLACGTGIVARKAVSLVGDTGSVIGLDINEGMLEVAQQTAGDRNIEWRHGSALEIPFEDRRFDLVCCQQAMQFFDEPVAALTEVRRVLTPGGRAMFTVWRPIEYQPGYRILADALERHVGGDAGTMMRSPFPDWDGDYLHTLADAAGCGDVEVTIELGSMRYPSVGEFVRQEAASSPLAAQIAAIDAETRVELVEEVGRDLDGYVDDHGLHTPMESFCLRWHE